MKVLRWLIVFAVLAAGAVTLKLTVLAPEVVTVRVAAVDRGLVEETITNTRAGTVNVRKRASLSPTMGGLVVALPHREGSTVVQGDLVLKLDDRAQRAELELARRDVRSAIALAEEACFAAELAVKELDRVTVLHGEGIASDQRLDLLLTERDRSQAGCAAVRASVEMARARVAVVEVQLEFTEVRAPFSGTVAELSTEVGEWITPAPPGVPIPPVIDLLDPGSLFISAPIDEVDAERVRVGQPARITVDSRPSVRYEGSVSRVAPYVLDDLEQNRTVEVEVEFHDDAETEGILPGTSADVEVILSDREDAVRIPASALAENSLVLLLENGVLEERPVVVGLKNWQMAEVLEGLTEGELVVTSRHSTDVKPGARAAARE
jgi:HlyD family secretion protein